MDQQLCKNFVIYSEADNISIRKFYKILGDLGLTILGQEWVTILGQVWVTILGQVGVTILGQGGVTIPCAVRHHPLFSNIVLFPSCNR